MTLQGTASSTVVYLYLLTLCPAPSFLPTEAHYLTQFSILATITAHCVLTTHKTHIIPVAGYTSLCCLYFLSLGINATEVDIPIATPLRETLKLIIFPALFIFAPTTSETSNQQIKRALYVLTAIQASIILITSTKAGAELVSLLYDTEKLSPGRSPNEKIRYLGSFENPNYLAFFLTISYAYLAAQSKNTKRIILLLVYLVLVLSTGSRTGLIALALVASSIHYRLILPAIISIVFLLNTDALFSSLPTRFQEITSVAGAIESHSLSIRLEILKDSIGLINERPFIGYFESPYDITDNWYVLMALRYGIAISLFALGVLASSLFLRFRTSFLNSRTAVFALIPLVFSLTGAFLDNPRLYGLATILFISTIRRPQSSKNIA